MTLDQPISPRHRGIITFTVMIVTIIEILDMTIVNVSLPHMMGSLGASADQITWVLTSYIVASAVVMPLTGFLINRFGQKKLLETCIVGFLISSMLCGASTTLAQIVFFRTLQGVFGAALVPLSQYILNTSYSTENRGFAMAIWGIGIMVAPVLGPTLGGFITESMNWRWVFYINIPVCLIAFLLTLRFVPQTQKQKVPIDWIGIFLMVVGIGCLQIFLDRGNTNDWLNSAGIAVLGIIWVFFLLTFIIRGINNKNNIIDFSIFKDKNFSVATFMLAIFGACLFGIIAMIPLMLENLMGYSAELAGLFMAPRAIASAAAMVLVSYLIKRFNVRLIIIISLIITAYGTYLMSHYNLDASFKAMLLPTIISGFGMGLFFVPIASISLCTLKPVEAAQGAGIFNFGRSLGGSIGISIISTLVTRESQINWNRLTGGIQSSNAIFRHWLAVNHLVATAPDTIAKLTQEIAKQSTMIAFVDAYYATAICMILMLPLVFLIKPAPKNKT